MGTNTQAHHQAVTDLVTLTFRSHSPLAISFGHSLSSLVYLVHLAREEHKKNCRGWHHSHFDGHPVFTLLVLKGQESSDTALYLLLCLDLSVRFVYSRYVSGVVAVFM